MKKQVDPVITAIALLAALAAVLFVYTKGLLTQPKADGGTPKGGGGGMGPAPPVGLQSVKVTTLAGWAAPGLVDGTGWEAKFNGPAGIALAPDGSLCVSDSRNHRVRRVTKDGVVTTVAGAGPVDCLRGGNAAGSGYADGPAQEARFFNPAGLCVAPDGAVYIADAGNHRIRALRDGRVTTVAGRETPKDELGCEQGGYRDGPAAQALFNHPVDVEVAPAGQLLIADLGNHALRRLAGGTVTTDAVPTPQRPGGPTAVLAAAAAGAEAVLADPETPRLLAWRTGSWGLFGNLRGHVPPRPTGLARLHDGVLIVVDAEWNAVFAVQPSGQSTLLAGTLPPQPASGIRDGTGSDALFAAPCAVAADGWTLYVADFGNNCIRRLEIPPDWAAPPPPPPDPRQRWWQQRGLRSGERDGDRSAR